MTSVSPNDPFYYTDTGAPTSTWVATVTISSVPGVKQFSDTFADYLQVRCIQPRGFRPQQQLMQIGFRVRPKIGLGSRRSGKFLSLTLRHETGARIVGDHHHTPDQGPAHA